MKKVSTKFTRMRKSAFKRRWGHFLKWSAEVNLRAYFEIILAVLALTLSGLTAYFFYQRAGPFGLIEGQFEILLHVTFGVILIFTGFVGHRLVKLFTGKSGRLQARFITFFGLMAVIPIFILAVFSGYILERGMQNWFSDRVRATLNNSLEVAETYLVEHRMTIQGDILAMAYDINSQAIPVSQNVNFLQLLVEDQMAKRSLNESIVFNGQGNVLAQASTSFSLSNVGISRAVLNRANSGELILTSDTSDDRVRAYLKLEAFADAYLYVSRFVDPKVLGHLENTRAAFKAYEAAEAERGNIQFGFELVFGAMAFLLFITAIWLGHLVAGSMTGPISKLAEAAEKVGQGKFGAQLPAATAKDEIGTLSRAFGRMIRKIESQQKDLQETNKQLDERRQFTEAVLSGVSASVIGLDKRGNIDLPNLAACAFFGKKEKDLIGKRLLTFMPDLKPLLCRVMEEGHETAQGQVTVELDGKERIVLVRIARESALTQISGYVITFDDITEQLSDQRTAAWADVARRIAHEIKNPLTPIQLSAERLRRKYSKSVAKDDPVFETCTETIIRQVGDLRRMVDEFSSFARMPKPVMRPENLTDIVRQALFLQEVSAPNIKFKISAPAEAINLDCDSRQVSQAMTNILKNAVESIKERSAQDKGRGNGKTIGHIKIDIQKTPSFGMVTIQDDGGGFPEDSTEKLLEPYVTTREKGTGLGLAIVRKIMEDHSGTIKLSKPPKGKGAIVTLTFKLGTQSKSENPVDKTTSRPGTIGREEQERVGRNGA